jgi:hypothetical protein
LAIAILEYIADKEWIMEGRVRAGVALASVMLAAEFSKIKISSLPPPSFYGYASQLSA